MRFVYARGHCTLTQLLVCLHSTDAGKIDFVDIAAPDYDPSKNMVSFGQGRYLLTQLCRHFPVFGMEMTSACSPL